MVVFLRLVEDVVYNAEPSLSQNHVKNIKIMYFNATDNCHHLVKAKANHIHVEEFAFSLLRLY